MTATADLDHLVVAATPTRTALLRRWFDLDDLALRQRLTHEGPQLIHWVAHKRIACRRRWRPSGWLTWP